jgi:hypothetical protein
MKVKLLHFPYTAFMTIKALIIGLSCALVVTACSFQKPTDQWEGYRDETLGIAFSYPASYLPEQVTDEDIIFGSGTIATKKVSFHEGQGETPSMEVTVTKKATIMKYLAQDHPLEDVTIGEKTLKQFHWDGMGDPVGYVLHQRPWVILTFTFPPAKDIQERMVESFVVTPKK